MKTEKTFNRFLSCIKISKSGCWEWIKGKDKDGYGKFKVNQKHLRAHRWSFEYFKHDLGALLCCHICDK